MIRNILFATDLGSYTAHALVHVESIASQYDAQISLVHAVPPISEFTSAIVKSYCSEAVKHELLESRNIKGLLESVRDEVFDLIATNALIEQNLLSRLGDIVIVPGKPACVILEEAERLKADLIVIGNHGPEAIDGRILGSVASKVLQLAKVPVLMVPMMEAITLRVPKHQLG